MIMNQEGNFDFEEYRGKLVGDKQANNQLKRQTSSIKAHMMAVIAASIVALTACTYAEIDDHSSKEKEEVTETGGIPFSEEKIAELEGNVVITSPKALENAYKDSGNDIRSDTDKQEQEAIDTNQTKFDQISPEKRKLIQKVIEEENNNLTDTQVIVKEAIDNALRVNEIIGKDGLSENELDKVIENSKAEHESSKNGSEGTVEISTDEENPQYWSLGDKTYAGISPQDDTATSVWVPTGDQTPYQQVGDEVWKSDPTWRQVSLEFDKVMHHMSYKDACPTNQESGSLEYIPVYATIDSAIQETNPWKQKKQYQEFLDSKIGTAHALIAGIYVPIEKVDGVSSFDRISFSLEKTNQEGQVEIVGYINGKDLLEGLSRNMLVTIQNGEFVSQESVPKGALQH